MNLLRFNRDESCGNEHPLLIGPSGLDGLDGFKARAGRGTGTAALAGMSFHVVRMFRGSQPFLWNLCNETTVPGAEAPGYCRGIPAGWRGLGNRRMIEPWSHVKRGKNQ